MLAADDARLDAVFGALSHRTRRAILVRLTEGEASVGELAEPFGLSLPAISKHIKVLEHAGLVTQGRRSQYRPCTLNPVRLDEAISWAQAQRIAWDGRLDRMEERLQQIHEEKS